MQGELNLRISHRTPLVPIAVARIHFGMTAEQVLWKIETGELLWVWDIAVHQLGEPVSSHRIWLRELFGPVPGLNLDQALASILGRERTRFTRMEITHLFCCSRPTVRLMVETRELAPDPADPVHFVTRASLEGFLRRRWLGSGKTRMSPLNTPNDAKNKLLLSHV